MKRWAAVAVGALLILWVPFLYWQLRREPPPPPPAATPVQPTAPAPAEPEPTPAPAVAPPVAEPEAPAPAQPAPAQPAPAPAQPTPAQPAPAQPALGPGAIPPGNNDVKNLPAPSGGPFDELKARYDKSTRDADAASVEAELRSQFGKDEVPADMLRSLSCRATVCRMQLLWSPERVLAFMRISMVWANKYSHEMSVKPGPKQDDGFTPLEAYFSRTPLKE